MRHSIILLALLGAGLTAGAQLGQTTTQWARLLDATAPDMGIGFARSGQALYFLSCTGTSVGPGESGAVKDYDDPTTSIYYDGECIATGAPYEGSGFNNNFSLVKTALDGTFVWTVYSTSGDFSSGSGGVVPSPDGGVYVSTVFRHTDNLRTQPITLVDASGQNCAIDWTLPDDEAKRWYQGLLLKVSAEGAIEWTRLITVSNAPVPAATGEHTQGTSLAFFISGMVGDEQGNCYISGRYAVPVTIDGVTLTPHNTEGWNGDSQQVRGDAFIAKVDPQGRLLATLTTTGVALAESNAVLTAAQGNLWLAMTFTGSSDGNCAITLDGHHVALPDDQQCVLLARLDTDLNVQWLQQWRGGKVQNRDAVMQNMRLAVAGDHLWFTGQCNGSFTDGTHTVATATGNIREGMLVKCAAATGEWLAATTSKTAFPTMNNGIQGYKGSFVSADGEHVYAFGETFGGECITLLGFDATTLTGEEQVTLIAGGSMPTAQQCIATGNTLYTLTRGRDSHLPSYQLQPIGSDLSLPTRDWAVCMAAFTLPFTVMEIHPHEAVNGDVNGDGVADVDDLNIVINIILHKIQDPSTKRQADLDGNGVVDISDVNAIINAILRKG